VVSSDRAGWIRGGVDAARDRNEAASRAVGQIVIEAMTKNLVAAAALDAAFKIQPTVVNRV